MSEKNAVRQVVVGDELGGLQIDLRVAYLCKNFFNMIREIVRVQNGTLQIQLPAEFIGKLIEVIAFPISADTSQHSVFQVKPMRRITVVAVKNKSYKFNREELYDR